MTMFRLTPIRRKRPRAPARAALRGADAAFWLVLALAVLSGGSRAVSGFPKLAELLLPTDVIAAQASDDRSGQTVSLPLSFDVAPQSQFGPQVLYPVVAHAFPDWLLGHHDATAPVKGVPKIAIVIDDLGADVLHTRRATALPRPVALSFLPYPDTTLALAREGARGGHEILVHVPMQAIGKDDPGPMALRTDLSAPENLRRLDWALSRVPGFVGINNHMGSKFSSDRVALLPVVERLADRHVFFFDSRTAPDSQVVTVARAFGVASASRDVFLDDVQTIDAVDAQLRDLERRAKEQGIAIAIGHPHEITLDAIAYWTAHEQGFELVPLSVAIRLKTEFEARRALSAR
jgi:polysaccharide deacetylase 2 family uncharacterized protein YibQ